MLKSKRHKLFSSESRVSRLWVFLVVVSIFFLLAQSLIYLSKMGRVTPQYSDDGIIISNSSNENDILEIKRNWILVPNVSTSDVRSRKFIFGDYTNMPHIENADISDQFGWTDVGSGVWNSNLGDNLFTVDDDNVYCAYLTKIIFPAGRVAPYYMSFPNVNGDMIITCNGLIVENTNKGSSDKVFDYTGGYNSYAITPNFKGEAEIIIAVDSHVGIPNPGINGTVIISSFDRAARVSTSSAIWYSIQISLFTLYVIGGAILLKTLKRRINYFWLLIVQFSLILYYAIDNRFLPMDDVTRFNTKHFLLLLVGFMSYLILSLIVTDSNKERKNLILKYDFLIPLFVAVVLLITPHIFNPDSFPLYTLLAEVIFVTGIVAANVIRIIRAQTNPYQYNISIVAIATSMFCMFHMIQGDYTLFSIKIYTFYILIAFLSFMLYFLFEYVRQNMEIQNTSEILKIKVQEKTAHITKINEDLTQTNKMLVENEEARKNVLSNVSHDLRTPITAIRGYVELLLSARKNMSDDQVDNYLNNIHRRSVQMERIVSDIMELTRMESNTNEFNFSEVSISELLDEIVMMYEGDLRGTHKKLTLDIPEGVFLMVNADYKKISRVFENLISNSINYTYEEGLIKVKAWREDGLAHVTIADNGIGIPEDEVNKIFDRFYRAKNSGQNIKGTGLGLSIVKTIIDHHDANITVESSIGEGTTFHITISVLPE